MKQSFQQYIRIVGARKNNLKNVSLDIPKKVITVFTGVSGSGKSSLVFDTIAAESQQQLNETFTTFISNRLPHYGQPEADRLENLSPVIVVDQKRLGGNSRSTVGTITDIYSLLRLLFSRVGQPSAGESTAYSFNDPRGMCPECGGTGTTSTLDVKKLIDETKSLNEGAFRFPSFAPGTWYWKYFTRSGFFDTIRSSKTTRRKRPHLVIERNLEVISQTDWIIDMGPEAGDAGGNVIFEGTPDELIRAQNSATSPFLNRYISG